MRRRRRPLEELTAAARPLWESGATVGEIAQALDLGRERVTVVMKALGVDGRTRGNRDRRADHGQPGRWMSGCDCDVCQDGRREYKRAGLEKARARAAEDPSRIPHGTIRGSMLGCSCPECRQAILTPARDRQDATLPGATRHAREWESWDTKIAADLTRTITDAAAATGRTYAAVSNIRAALADPEHPAHAHYQALRDA